MNEAEPGALIDPSPELIEAMTKNPKDRHVPATAVAAGGEVLVTFNLSDFPVASCNPYGVAAQHPDEFVKHLVDLDPAAIRQSITRMAGRRKDPPATSQDVRDYLGEMYIPRAMAPLRVTASWALRITPSTPASTRRSSFSATAAMA